MTTMHETVLRYEDPPKKIYGHAEKRHKAEQEKYREFEEFVRKLKTENMATERAKRLHASVVKLGTRKMVNCLKQCQTEAHVAGKATIMVRRRALEVQQQREMEQYNKELAAMGKTFHIERL